MYLEGLREPGAIDYSMVIQIHEILQICESKYDVNYKNHNESGLSATSFSVVTVLGQE